MSRIKQGMLKDFATGAAFLGSGGGGDPYYSYLLAEAAVRKSGHFDLISLDQLDDDALVAPCGWIGAPTVSVEKLPNGQETVNGLRRLEDILGRKVDAVMPIEIGGGNGLAPLIAAAEMKIPVVDADGMGRAFPESQMTILNIRGVSACPAVLTSSSGAISTIETPDNHDHERLARSLSVAFGGIAHMVEYPMSGLQARANAIPGSVSAAIAIGEAIRTARETGRSPFDALTDALDQSDQYGAMAVLIDGKISDLQVETKGGFSIGKATISTSHSGEDMVIAFQNENLVASQADIIRATVPDLITIMDRETAEPVTTERLKYGQRVKVVAAAAPEMLRTETALKFVGPRAFGLDTDFKRLESIMNGAGS